MADDDPQAEDDDELGDTGQTASCATSGWSGGNGHGSRVIVHIDLDAYYAQCEMLRDPSLRGKAFGIQQKYLIVTCSYEARKKGVTKLQSIVEAKKRCPELIIVNGEDLTLYRECSERIQNLLKTFTHKLERLGLDETYIDCTDLVERALTRGSRTTSPRPTGPFSPSSLVAAVTESYNASGEAPMELHGDRAEQRELCGFTGHLYTPAGTHRPPVTTASQSGPYCIAADGGVGVGGGNHFDHHSSGSTSTSWWCGCGCVERMAAGSRLADEMRTALRERLGFNSCAGISNNKMLAKLAGEIHKPNQQTIILPQDAEAFVYTLPGRKLPGIGWSTGKSLSSAGIDTAAQLRALPPAALHAHGIPLNKARVLLDLARGVDMSPVVVSGLFKSLSEEDSFKTCTSRLELKRKLHDLLVPLLTRIEERRLRHMEVPHTLRVTIRQRTPNGDPYRSKESRQCPIPNPETLFSRPDPLDRQEGLYRFSWELLDHSLLPASEDTAFDLTLLNVCVTAFHTVAGARKRREHEGGTDASSASAPSDSILRFVKRRTTPPQSSHHGPPTDPQQQQALPTEGALDQGAKHAPRGHGVGGGTARGGVGGEVGGGVGGEVGNGGDNDGTASDAKDAGGSDSVEQDTTEPNTPATPSARASATATPELHLGYSYSPEPPSPGHLALFQSPSPPPLRTSPPSVKGRARGQKRKGAVLVVCGVCGGMVREDDQGLHLHYHENGPTEPLDISCITMTATTALMNRSMAEGLGLSWRDFCDVPPEFRAEALRSMLLLAPQQQQQQPRRV